MEIPHSFQPPRGSGTMESSIGVCRESEGNDESKEMDNRKAEKYLIIKIWSLNTAKANSSSISILNCGILPGRC